MDLSKLPKMSRSTPPAPAAAPPEPVAPPLAPAAPRRAKELDEVESGAGLSAWLSAIIGLVLMLMARGFASYLLAKVTGQPFHTGVTWQTPERQGQEVGYWELQGYTGLSDSAIFLFGAAMVIEAAVLAGVAMRLSRMNLLLYPALLVAGVATLLNAVVAAMLFGIGIMPLLSLLAVGFGVYMVIYEWRLLGIVRHSAVQ